MNKERLDSMGRRNGMFNKENAKKRVNTIKKRYPTWGNFNIGKKRPDLSKRNKENVKSGKEHPRWNRIYKKNCKYCNTLMELSFCFRNQKFCNVDCYGKYLKENFSDDQKQFMSALRAKQILPKKDSSIEVKIQNFLKQLKIEFFTHKKMNIEHSYQCDILIPSMNLVIECDGDFIHCNPSRYSPDFVRFPNSKRNQPASVVWELDEIRTSELLSAGFKVLRLWEHEIKIININQFKNKLTHF